MFHSMWDSPGLGTGHGYPALAGIFFTTTVPWEAPNIGTYVLYLIQIVKKKDNNKTRREKVKFRKVKFKIIFIETIYRKVGKE